MIMQLPFRAVKTIDFMTAEAAEIPYCRTQQSHEPDYQ